MPDIGWMELLVVGVVALIVMGPRDFPMLFRKLGQATGKLRRMAREFQRAMDEAADETGMTELNRDLKKATDFSRNPAKAGMDALNETFSDLDPSKFEEGSETRELAEAKAKRQAEIREKTEAVRAARAAKLADIEEAADDMAAEAMQNGASEGAAVAPEPTLRPAVPPAAEPAAPEPAAAAAAPAGPDKT